MPNEAQRAIAKSCDVSASALFTAASLETIPTLTLDPIDFDTPSSSFLGEIDIGLLIEYFTTGPCQLFSDATKMLEISRSEIGRIVDGHRFERGDTKVVARTRRRWMLVTAR